MSGLSVTTPDLNTIEATWTPLTGDETGGQPIVEYRLQYTQDDGDGVREDSDWVNAITPLLTTDADSMETWKLEAALEENKNYYARIIAVNRVGPDATDALRPESGQDAETTALGAAEVVRFSTGEAAPPNEPEGLTSEQATNRTGELLRGVDLRWNKPSDGSEVGTYEIERKIGDGEWEAPTDDSEDWRSTLTLFTDPRPYEAGEMLAYQVRAKNEDGESDWVEVDYPRDPPAHMDHMLGDASGLTAVNNGDGTVTLSWTPGPNSNIHWVAAARRDGTGFNTGAGSTVWEKADMAASHTVNVSNLHAGTYAFTVIAGQYNEETGAENWDTAWTSFADAAAP